MTNSSEHPLTCEGAVATYLIERGSVWTDSSQAWVRVAMQPLVTFEEWRDAQPPTREEAPDSAALPIWREEFRQHVNVTLDDVSEIPAYQVWQFLAFPRTEGRPPLDKKAIAFKGTACLINGTLIEPLPAVGIHNPSGHRRGLFATLIDFEAFQQKTGK